mgnify:CR=1 FL=1
MKPEHRTAINEAQAEWEEGPLARVLSRFPERRSEFRSSSAGVARFYTPNDVADLDYLRDVGFPGQYPFTRGVQPTMYRGRLWTMRQYAGFGTPEETNERFRELLANGQTGLSTAFDLPTQTGYDSDDPMAAGEVGHADGVERFGELSQRRGRVGPDDPGDGMADHVAHPREHRLHVGAHETLITRHDVEGLYRVGDAAGRNYSKRLKLFARYLCHLLVPLTFAYRFVYGGDWCPCMLTQRNTKMYETNNL